ncbi:UPF0721 transmembrane protein [Cytophagales bacterium WSM2-2]|nr:UPF0721 transmembrane protein [Cytophagales bacterium WSM2-2]
MTEYFILLVAGLLGGTLNAVAGGGTFITFSALVYAGLPSVAANASSTIALFPGSVASVFAYRNDVKNFEAVSLKSMIWISLIGGSIGALSLLFTSSKEFDIIVPWLVLVGSLVFLFGKWMSRLLQSKANASPVTLLVCQFFLAIYGGYFGGAAGVMMLAVWTLFGFTDLKLINANKTLLVGTANATAVVIFIFSGKIWWMQTGVMILSTVAGGYFGAAYARKLPQKYLKWTINAFVILITMFFFYRAYAV